MTRIDTGNSKEFTPTPPLCAPLPPPAHLQTAAFAFLLAAEGYCLTKGTPAHNAKRSLTSRRHTSLPSLTSFAPLSHYPPIFFRFIVLSAPNLHPSAPPHPSSQSFPRSAIPSLSLLGSSQFFFVSLFTLSGYPPSFTLSGFPLIPLPSWLRYLVHFICGSVAFASASNLSISIRNPLPRCRFDCATCARGPVAANQPKLYTID